VLVAAAGSNTVPTGTTAAAIRPAWDTTPGSAVKPRPDAYCVPGTGAAGAAGKFAVPAGFDGSSRRALRGWPNGTFGALPRIATTTSSSGFSRSVSFQPTSSVAGGLTVPSQPTRLTSCTSTMLKWIEFDQKPLSTSFQICISPSPMMSVGASM